MELPIELRNIIEEKLNKINIKEIQKDAENISVRYRNESGKGKKLLTKENEALAYSIVRMPATYGAIYTALEKIFEFTNNKYDSLLDIGAGTGAGTWAALQFNEFKKVTCLEREEAMINLGNAIMKESENDIMKLVNWKKFDFITDEIEEKADLVICSYVLNELDEKSRAIALTKLWNATNKVLLILEPGTPIGFKEVKTYRAFAKENNGTVIAPCPNMNECPIKENDWCHSTCRISRTKVHKLLKNGDVPYEDEKFSYIAISKIEHIKKDNIRRILRHPKIESGKISLIVCTDNGIEELNITKKNKEMFKKARKANCGDVI